LRFEGSLDLFLGREPAEVEGRAGAKAVGGVRRAGRHEARLPEMSGDPPKKYEANFFKA
jgi:hypothetical protein